VIDWIRENIWQITGVVSVMLVLGLGRQKLLPAVRQSPALLWLAFAVTIPCGLVLGWALEGVTGWLVGLPGLFGGVVGSVGAIAALILGWHGVYYLIPLIRDVADRVPDGDARRAALWVPTFLPAGWSAVLAVASNPRGLGSGITAAIMAGVTIVYAHLIVKEALKARTAPKAWRWFAAGVCLLAGACMIPLLIFADAELARWLPDWLMQPARILAGAAGLAMLVAAVKDIVDKVPDQHVRRFFAYGLPLLVLFGAAALAWLSSSADSGLDLIVGSSR
jgi:hypothetical protein